MQQVAGALTALHVRVLCSLTVYCLLPVGLMQRAMDLKREEEEAKERLSRNFKYGKLCYERGEYPAAVQFLLQVWAAAGEERPV